MRWQPVETHIGLYEVSSCGKIRNNHGRVLKQWKNDQGYSLVRLSNPRCVQRVHRIVASSFIKNPLNLPFVNHLDFDRSNNHKSNLEWCTQWHNLKHSDNFGRMQRDYWAGKRSPNAKLSDDDVKKIRNIYCGGGYSWQSLSEIFGVSKRTIGRIINMESYT